MARRLQRRDLSGLGHIDTAAEPKSALDAFVGIDNVTVTGSSGSFTVTFGGTQSQTNMSQIFGDAAATSWGATLSTITSVYDANDQLTSISDPNATIDFTRDNLGRAPSIANAITGLTPAVTLTQAFNAAGVALANEYFWGEFWGGTGFASVLSG